MHFVQEETVQLDSEFGGSCGDGGNWQIGRPRPKNRGCCWLHTDVGLWRTRLVWIMCIYMGGV